ncbi:ribulose-phosphate 3-epimerase [Microbotryum lychnidis-dioicae p1A1 Lamole]|uniref:Ribulose-phosphate 3-epimerase n=1 Tax=Microbotryum lychnidis-dioicae (strain p1A1 Lamole / MvSl-1064) TaxID=683840 RepID=U5HH63_USTV1|nr:ribulose-phosphate 3-epimerase [Microbotryum lychnidis-dioicae p1A1 Lamole]|eukprot:KDE03106.1 ribulose-phosphate 3-epimerase [Microbotryum lychnidis-dioicae p1A1 Lamole]
MASSSSSPQAIISPSVLASNFGDLSNEIRRMMSCGAQWVHMDVMDGHFVPNITIGPPVFASVHKTVENVFMDCHMMVADPARWVKDVADAGGKSYTFHLEALSEPEKAHELVQLIHSTGMRAAVAISPATPSSAISDALGNSVDMLLVMTVVPGKGGQKFMPECVPKVAELRTRFPNKDIQVDGGVGPGTIGCCARAGSNVIVAGTALFGAKEPKQVIQGFKEAIESSREGWGTDKALTKDE